ncbi:MAG: hypothetical protein QM779_09845 [Propionicimonas sp.]|uniref:hypothetical protein n=1 Tax=Propionicimonas sp. TaxID=1955623 RepID=UPI003D0E370E
MLVAAVLGAASGCTDPVAPTVPVAATTTSSAAIAERLDAAIATGSQTGFVSAFSSDDRTRAVASSGFGVLTAGSASLTSPADGRLRADYRLPGDRGPAAETVRFTLEPGTDRIASMTADGDTLPLWAYPDVVVTPATSGTLVSVSLDAASRTGWADRLDRAARVVDAAGVGQGWTGGLVVEVPPQGRFGEVSGASADDASAITVCGSGTPRIVVNPAVLSQPAEWLDSTLVHEAVHVATNSACVASGASLGWAVEGLAESVAAASDRGTASRNRALVVAHLKEHGVPDALPADPESLTDYALAQFAADQVRAHLGADADEFWQRAIHDADSVSSAEIARITRWYRDALADLA